ncbi:MAG TPA: DoxX family membrane protein [Chitinophagales bacterium]|nr:DoxX family membrane protein [Chitinophagales bacterium]
MNNALSPIGRIIYALAIAFFGIAHLTSADQMAGNLPPMFSSLGAPLIYFTGVCLLLAAISFIINRWARIAGILLAIFLLLIVFTVHMPHLPDQTATAMVIKDTAMAGAALMIAGYAKS